MAKVDNDLSNAPLKMGRKQRWIYATFAMTRVMLMGFTLHLEKYFTDKIGFSAALFGTAYLVYAIINSINDPFVGALMNIAPDNKKYSKYKRFLLLGMPIILIGMVFSIFVSPAWPEWLIFIFLFLGLSIADTGYAMHQISINCLVLGETSEDSDRAKFQGITMILATVGGIIASLLPAGIMADNDATQYEAGKLLVIIAIAGAVIYLLFWFILKPKAPRETSTEQKKVWPIMVRFLKDKRFILFIIIAFFAGIGPSMGQTFNAYYLDNVLEIAPESITAILGISLPIQFVLLGLSGLFVKKIGFERLFFITTGILIVVYGGILAGITGTLGIVLALIMGSVGQMWWIISFGLIGQITDRYKQNYGEVDDAMFMGIQAILISPAVSVGKFVFFQIIEAFGYNPNVISQTPRALFGLQLAIGGVGGVSLVIALIAMIIYVKMNRKE